MSKWAMEFQLLAGFLEGFARLSLKFFHVGFDLGEGLGFHAVDEEDAGEVVGFVPSLAFRSDWKNRGDPGSD